jgi:hypothetical protein
MIIRTNVINVSILAELVSDAMFFREAERFCISIYHPPAVRSIFLSQLF